MRNNVNFYEKIYISHSWQACSNGSFKKPTKKDRERVFLTEDAQKNLNRENQSKNLLKNIHVFYKSRKELNNLCGKDEISHQGLIAEVEHLEEQSLKEYLIDCKK